jgi:hypothetical protein
MTCVAGLTVYMSVNFMSVSPLIRQNLFIFIKYHNKLNSNKKPSHMASNLTLKGTFHQHNFLSVQLCPIVSLCVTATFENGGRRCCCRCQWELQTVVIKLSPTTAESLADCRVLGLTYCTAQ